MRYSLINFIFFGLFCCGGCCRPVTSDYSSWETYAGTSEGNRYSSNVQITRENVHLLQPAWYYSTHDKDSNNRSQNQCNPICVNDVLYGTSPRLKLFALDAATGDEKWVFDPALYMSGKADPATFNQVSRGVIYWENEQGGEKCILYSAGPWLFAIHAEDGTPVRDFGTAGVVDLRMHLSLQHPEAAYVSGTTPGVVFRDLLIMGMRVSEGSDGPPGHILAFHVRTGKLQWKFHTIPQPGEFGYDTWDDPDAWTYTGGANSWAGLALDKARGLVYVPTGSATPDFYGGYRKGANLFANSLIALEAASGKYVWHFQIVHHDLWDRDLPANPNLVTLHRDGRRVDAVAQITKHGYVFVFDRSDGTPLFPIEERPVPQEALPGEKTWPTQPFPVLPEPFARQYFRPEDVYSPDSSLRQLMLEKYHQVAHRLMFTPPGKEGAWIFPGFDGGGQWGGAAFDPETQVMYVNSSELPWSQTMTEVSVNTSDHSLKAIGESIYKRDCLMCHGKNREGNLPAYPSLLGLENRFTLPQLSSVVENGRNMMPAFKHISQADRQALYTFLLQLPEKEGTEKAVEVPESKEAKPAVRYRMTGYNRFLDPLGYPGIKPPWGTLNAIDLNTGERVWQVPLGEYPELTKKGIPVTGTENYGGPVVTKGGLIFIAATKDEKMRAFDKQTGEVLWEGNLPAAGYATPSTYMAGGRQYVVIACGGGKIGSKSGDQYVAFALP